MSAKKVSDQGHGFDPGPGRRRERESDETSRLRLELSATRSELDRRQRFTDVLLETIEVGIVFCDAEGRGWVRNRAERALLGLPETLHRATGPDSAAPQVDVLDLTGRPLPTTDYPLLRALRGDDVGTVHLLIGPAGGPLREVVTRNAQIVDADGVVLGAVSTLTDISVEQQSLRDLALEHRALLELEQATREASGFFNAVLDGLPDDIYVVNLSDGELVFASVGKHVLPQEPDDIRERVAQFQALIDEEDAARIDGATAAVADLADGEVLDLRYRVGGSEAGRWINHRLTPFNRTVDGAVTQCLGVVRDITAVVEAEDELVEADRVREMAESRFRNVFEQAGIGAVIMRLDGRPTHVNAAACVLMGRPREVLIAKPWSPYLAPDQVPTEDLVMTHLRAGRDTFTGDRRYLRPDGSTVWANAHVTLVRDQHGAPDYLLAQLEDITERKRMEADLDRQALHDPLTGLPNRFLFADRVRQALVEDTAEPVTVLLLLLGGLHAIIDSEGYAAGDLVLKEIACRLAGSLGDVTIANLQPGQFGILVKGDTGDAIAAADRALATVGTPVDLPAGSVAVRGRIGICVVPAERTDPGAVVGRLIQDAASAAGRAGSVGSTRIAFASPELRQAQEDQQRIEVLVRDALDNDLVRVAYQPVIDLSNGRLVGAEALLRLTDTDGRPARLDQVIPVAEKSGLIVELGRRVLHLAAEQSARWLADHGVLLPIAVNVSAVQLERPEFLNEVLDATARVGLPTEALSIELTESVLLESGSVGIKRLHVLCDAGILLAIDDFGTGYASLTYLRDLPATTLKIDQSFVAGVPHDRGSVAIVASVIELARNFGMACIAEGIETEEQRIYLAARGVLGQGYLLGRPGTGAAISAMLVD